MTRLLFLGFALLAACDGGETDTDTSTAETGTPPATELAGIWAGTCTASRAYKKKTRTLEVFTQVALTEEAGVVDGFGSLTVTKGYGKKSKSISFDVNGTFDDATLDVDLDFALGNGEDILLDFVGTVTGDTIDATMQVVPLDKYGKPKKIDPKYKAYLLDFDCSLDRQLR